MSFQMKVEDIFNFESGRTILLGPKDSLKGELHPQSGQKCRLFQDDIMVCDVETIGFEMPLRPTRNLDRIGLGVKPLAPLPSGPTSGEWLLKQI